MVCRDFILPEICKPCLILFLRNLFYLTLENKVLRQVSADYKRVKRVFGPEQVKAAVQADKQREQAEKAHKRSRRSFSRDGR